jgi:hypothetical protein
MIFTGTYLIHCWSALVLRSSFFFLRGNKQMFENEFCHTQHRQHCNIAGKAQGHVEKKMEKPPCFVSSG